MMTMIGTAVLPGIVRIAGTVVQQIGAVTGKKERAWQQRNIMQ